MIRGLKPMARGRFMAALGFFIILAAGDPAGAEELLCASCHFSAPAPPLGALAWQGPLAGEMQSPCPGVRLVKKELLLTQSRLERLGIVLARRLGAHGPAHGLKAALEREKAGLRAALIQPVVSGGQVKRVLRGIRAGLDREVYRPLLASRRAAGEIWFWLLMLVLALGVGLAAWWGLRGLRAAQDPRERGSQGWRPEDD